MADDAMKSTNKEVRTDTSQSAPWGPAQPGMRLGIKDAMSLYKSKKGFQPFKSSLVIDHSAKRRQGMAGIQNTARAYGRDMARPLGFNSGILRSGGFNKLQNTANSQIRSRAAGDGTNAYSGAGLGSLRRMSSELNRNSGLNSIQREALGGFQDMASNGGLTADQQANLSRINDIAAGGMMDGNPYLESVLNDISQDVSTNASREASGMGRYGSDEHSDVLSRNVGELSRQIRMADYNQQLGRMDSAMRDGFNMAQQGSNNQMNAYGSIGNLGATGVAQQAQADQALFNAGNTAYANKGNEIRSLFQQGQQGIQNQSAAANQMANSYNMMQQPYRDMIGVGEAEEELAALKLQDKLRVHQEAQAEPWDRLLAMQGIVGGAGRVGGSKSSQSEVRRPGVSPFQAMVGGGLQAYDQGMNPFMGATAGYLGLPAT